MASRCAEPGGIETGIQRTGCGGSKPGGFNLKKSRLYKINRFLGQTITGEKCPEIRWNDIVRIEAFGTDVVSAFAIMVIFQHVDGSEVSVHPEQRGYFEIIESLDERFPSIPPDWFEEMQAEGKELPDVRRLLYSRSTETPRA